MMMCNGQRETYLPLISQRVSSHLSGHTLLIKDAFWQPVAGNEMFSLKTHRQHANATNVITRGSDFHH
uniref:Uncharacterized protein n=1 Tax=Poecilia mexicana TaxID=48701 RepID=A0A3B3XNX3_9TELE